MYCRYLVDSGCVPLLCKQLSDSDQEVVLFIVESLQNLLRIDPTLLDIHGVNPYAAAIAKCGGRERLSALCVHSNPQIAGIAASTLAQYFPEGNDLPGC